MTGQYAANDASISFYGMTFRLPNLMQLFVCVFGAFVMTAADNAATYASIGPLDRAFWLRTATRSLLLLLLFWCMQIVVTRRKWHNKDTGDMFMAEDAAPVRWLRTSAAWWSKHGVLFRGTCLSLLMVLCWLPYIRLIYPGLIWYDTGDQIAQFYGYPALEQPAGVISAHHPVFDTIVFGLVAKAGELWLGGYQAGLTLLILMQAVLMCVLLASCVMYVRHVGAPRGTAALLFLFFALFPALPIFYMTLVKDSLHSLVFLPWLLMYVEACRTRLASLKSACFAVPFVLLGILSSLTTATGFYITALSLLGLPLVTLLRKKHDRALLASISAGIAVVSIVVVHVVFPAIAGTVLNIHKEDPNQILVLPMQMTARYVIDNPSDVRPEERRVIDSINNVPVEQMPKQYNPYLADPIIHLSLKNPSYLKEYIAVWFAQGLRHPKSYINAFAALESGWFSWQHTSLYEFSGLPLDRLRAHAANPVPNKMLLQTDNFLSIPFQNLPAYHENRSAQSRLREIWERVSHIPVLRLLTYTAVWSFVLPLFMAYSILERRETRAKALVIGAPLIWSLLSLLPNAISVPLKPTGSRYIMWALYVVPVYIALLRANVFCERQSNKEPAHHVPRHLRDDMRGKKD